MKPLAEQVKPPEAYQKPHRGPWGAGKPCTRQSDPKPVKNLVAAEHCSRKNRTQAVAEAAGWEPHRSRR